LAERRFQQGARLARTAGARQEVPAQGVRLGLGEGRDLDALGVDVGFGLEAGKGVASYIGR